MPKPKWKRQQWSVARVAAVMAEVADAGGKVELKKAAKRFGIGPRELSYMSLMLGSDEDVGVNAAGHLSLDLGYDDDGTVSLGGIGAKALEPLTRVSKEQARLVARGLRGLAMDWNKKKPLLPLIERLEKASGGRFSSRFDIVVPGPELNMFERWKLSGVAEACSGQHPAAFWYYAAGKHKRQRKVLPLIVRQDLGEWRVLCWDLDRKALRTFNLGEIRRFSYRRRETFVWPAGLARAELEKKDLSVFVPNGTEQRVKMRVSPQVYAEFKAVFEKKIKKRKDGWLDVTCLTASPQWLVSTFLPVCDGVRVVGPENHRKLFRHELSKVIAETRTTR